MSTLPISAIKVGKRIRSDLGDLSGLRTSIAARGLLHPIVVTPDNRLVAGHRRLEACRLNGMTEVPVTVYRQVDDVLHAEGDENTCRKDFTPSEAVAFQRAIEAAEKAAAKARQREHGKTAPGKSKPNTSSKLEEVSPAERTTRARTAKPTGYSATTLDKARAVVEAAEQEPEKFAPVVEEMDRSGRVDPAFRLLEQAKAKEQGEQVKAAVEHAVENSGEVAAAFLKSSLMKFWSASLKSVNNLDAEACALVVERADLELADEWASKVEQWMKTFRDELSRPVRLVKEAQ